MKHLTLIAYIFLILIGIAACSPAAAATPAPSPEVPPTPVEGFHPLSTRTGNAVIDSILEAVASGDPQELRSLVEFTDAVCTQLEGLGGPPKCREGEAEGTPVEVLSFLSSEGHFLRKDEIEQWGGVNASGIYAVYEVNAAVVSSEQYYPVGNTVVLLVGDTEQDATAVRVGETGIVRVDTVFDSSPEALNAMIEREASNVILAPVSQ